MKIINWINNSGWKKVFTTCLVLGAFFHLLAVFFSEGFHRPDEHLGIMRFIACKLGIFSTEELGKLSWEYPARIRNWIQPGLYYPFARLSYILDIKNPFFISGVFRFISSTIGMLSLVLLAFLSRKFIKSDFWKKFALIALFSTWYFPFFHARPTAENLGMTLFIFGIYLILKEIPVDLLNHSSITFNKSPRWKPDWKLSLLSGLFLGLAVNIRIPMANMVFFFVLWLFTYGKLKIRDFFILAGGIILSILLCIILDRWGYGQWTWSTYNYLYHEFVNNVSHGFGTDPWYKYIIKTFSRGFPPLSFLFIVPFIWLWIRKPGHVITWCTLPYFVVHSMIGHKELRYIFCMGLWIPILAALFFEEMVRHKYWIKIRLHPVFKILLCIIIIENFILLTVSSIKPAYGPIGFYKHLYHHKNEISGIYTLNLVRDQLRFYQKRDIVLTHVEDRNNIHGIIEESVGNLWFLTDKIADRGIFEKTGVCSLDYSSFPEWMFKFNIDNWMKRSKIWTLYKCSKN